MKKTQPRPKRVIKTREQKRKNPKRQQKRRLNDSGSRCGSSSSFARHYLKAVTSLTEPVSGLKSEMSTLQESVNTAK
ncbi:hypothetical protein [Vibrio phage J14]|nr:hypothetical protein [Vibrio phage J14]